MVLDYAKEKYDKKIPRFSIKKIAKIVKTRWPDGTAPMDVENMNEALRGSIPSVEFKAVFLGRFPEIIEELEREQNPVIVWVNCVEPPDTVLHAVVITGFDPETNAIYYNDPESEFEKKEDVGTFIKKWGWQARLVKVLIGKKQQRLMTEWAETREEEMGE